MHRSDRTINLILAAVGSFYVYQDRLGVETAMSHARRLGAKSPYKPFLHGIGRPQLGPQALLRVRTKAGCASGRLLGCAMRMYGPTMA